MNPETAADSYYEFQLTRLVILEAQLKLRMQARAENGYHALESDVDSLRYFAWAKFIIQRELETLVGI
jgi:hypothetical protein